MLISWSSKRLLEVWKAQKKPLRSLSGMETRDVLFCLNVVLLMSLSSQYVVVSLAASRAETQSVGSVIFSSFTGLSLHTSLYLLMWLWIEVVSLCLLPLSPETFLQNRSWWRCSTNLEEIERAHALVGAVWSQFVRFS